LTGIRTNGGAGELLVESGAGNLTVNQAVCAGTLTCGLSTAKAALAAAGDLTETGAGMIDADQLIANAGGNVMLDNANQVVVIAGNANGTYRFTDAVVNLNIDPANSGLDGSVVALGISTTGGDIRLRNSGTLSVVSGNVCAGVAAFNCVNTPTANVA